MCGNNSLSIFMLESMHVEGEQAFWLFYRMKVGVRRFLGKSFKMHISTYFFGMLHVAHRHDYLLLKNKTEIYFRNISLLWWPRMTFSIFNLNSSPPFQAIDDKRKKCMVKQNQRNQIISFMNSICTEFGIIINTPLEHINIVYIMHTKTFAVCVCIVCGIVMHTLHILWILQTFGASENQYISAKDLPLIHSFEISLDKFKCLLVFEY